MQFNSYEFIFFFLPIAVILYFALSRIQPVLGKLVIIAASIVFYALGRPQMLLYLGISMLINYASALLIRRFSLRSKAILALSVAVNVVLLLYFKYLNFTITNVNMLTGSDFQLKDIILPLGISFYTFQQIAYLVATARGELESNNLIDYLTYILFFPKLIMGPIVDPVDFISQINEESRKRVDLNHIASGVKLFSLGLLKKVLLADTFARGVACVYESLNDATAIDCLLLILFYTFEIYFDFSGYSDMATGVSLVINIDLPMNFDSPYKAVSVRDFWKRWHISLTKFLTKYIYIPLGGSRKGRIFTYVNTMIVFLVSGLWHGANWTFVLWGLLHGLFSCADRLLEKWEERIPKLLRQAGTFIVVSVLWLIFSAESVGQWLTVLRKLIFSQHTAVSGELLESFRLAENGFLFDLLHLGFIPDKVPGIHMILFILVSGLICFVPENNYRKKDRLSVLSLLGASLAFVWGVLCLGAESTFVYFGF